MAGGADEPIPEVLLSRQLVEARGLSVGEVVSFSADPSGSAPHRFRIAGVYEPVPDPMRFAARRHEGRLHLSDLLALTSDPTDPHAAAQSVTAVNVKLHRPEEAPGFIRAVGERSPGLVSVPARPRGDVFVVLEKFHEASA